MAIIPGKWCEDCEMDGDMEVPAEHEWDTWGVDSGGRFLCDTCASRRQDAYEPDYDAIGIAERCEMALRERNELRRR